MRKGGEWRLRRDEKGGDRTRGDMWEMMAAYAIV